MINRKTLWLLLATMFLASCQTAIHVRSDADLTALAQRGNGKAQYQLAKQLAERGQYIDAMQWMQKVVGETERAATREMRADAALQVGDWYQAGLGEPKNIPSARRWWNTALRLGNGEAGYRLGSDCQAQHQGKLVTACLDAFASSADNGYAPAQLIMAQWYADRIGGEDDAVNWLKKAAERENKDAQYQLALRYEQGKGVAIRHDLAERWYYRAATQGQPQAQLWMAQHEDGDNALSWYYQAASNGEPNAQLWLANAYLSGNPFPSDAQKANHWLTRAAASGSAEANYLLSQQQDNSEKREHFLMEAAAAGYVPAQRELAAWLVERNELARARTLYIQAAQSGDDESRLALGEMLRWALGGKADFVGAVKQYRLAAQNGNKKAQYRMGMMRQEGLGIPQNRIHAYAWYAMAATEGMTEAIRARDALEAIMQPDEIKAGQRLALHWSSSESSKNE